MKCTVNATSLRLRKGPSLNDAIITTLPNGQVVNVLDSNNAEWWEVSTVLNNSNYTGYAACKYLSEIKTPPVVLNPNNVIAVHYPISTSSNRNSSSAKHTPLSESDVPKRNVSSASSPESKIADIYRIINYLNVEQSLRYQKNSVSTFCNIYAYDFCYAAQAYLPRVWWTSKTLMEFAKQANYNPVPAYAKNVLEMNANALYDWLEEWGDDFGWMRTYDMTELQEKVNAGRVGIVCAKRKNLSRSGHITCVIPEANGFSALRAGGKVTAPLQSQAGVKNKKTFADTWWIRLASEYSNFGYWWHD